MFIWSLYLMAEAFKYHFSIHMLWCCHTFSWSYYASIQIIICTHRIFVNLDIQEQYLLCTYGPSTSVEVHQSLSLNLFQSSEKIARLIWHVWLSSALCVHVWNGIMHFWEQFCIFFFCFVFTLNEDLAKRGECGIHFPVFLCTACQLWIVFIGCKGLWEIEEPR